LAQWFRGPLADMARGVARSEALVGSGWFDRSALAQLAERHISGASDHGRVLYQLVMLEKSLARLGIR
jgi:asparagine synthase (glutamine-hydrolysing)